MYTMDSYTVLNIISIFIYPLLLAVVSVLRFNCFSLCYLLMFFLSPFLPAAKRGQSTAVLRICLTIVLILSSVFILTQSAYNIAIVSLGKNESSDNCSLGELTNQIGLHQFQGMIFYRVLRIFLPDFAVCIFAILTLYLIRQVERSQYHALAGSATAEENLNENTHNSYASFSGAGALPLILQRELILNSVFNIATIACFVLASIMSPSVLSAVYLVVCLIFATLWACMKLSKALPPFRILLIIYVALHVLTYYLYQFPFSQSILPSNTFTARLLGLYWLFQTNCSQPGEIIFNQRVRWTEYVTPPVTVMLYYVLTRGTRRTMSPRASQLEEPNDGMELEPMPERLISDGGVEAPNYSAVRQASPSEAAGTAATAPLQPREVEAPTEKPFLVSLLSKVIRVSYIVTFLSMMAWSIIYVSWLSFVMLLTACLIWVVPKSRLVCLHLSPFIVFYGSMMLCLQYIFAMNLPELPTEINGLTLSYFGMKKYEQPVGVLAVQFGLMLGFWLTLRLYTTEKMMQERQTRTLELSTVSRGGLLRLDTIVFGTEENRTFRGMMNVLHQTLVKVWIIFTCLLMFFISTQQPVVLFRVVYMVLFLYFMFTFIVSYDFWRRQMIIFWWVVIVYSMIVLIGIYTFQFKEVRSVWSDFIQNATLVDMGLQEFESSGLFLRLTTPVIFLVVVIFQVHYFHADFIRISVMSDQTESAPHERQRPEDCRSHGETSVTTEDFVTDVTTVFHTIRQKFARFWNSRHIVWRFLEVHIDKIVIITAAVCAVQTISALWVPMILIYALMLPLMRSHTISLALLYVWVGLIIIAKMSFQLPSFIQLSTKHNASDCQLSNLTYGHSRKGVISITNDTDWAGLKGAVGYRVDISYPMALLVIIIINMVVHYHQRLWYRRRDRNPPPEGIIFENVKLHDIQKNLVDFLKFIFNHGFYKLGLEIFFIVNVIGIVIRLDVYSLVYLVFTFGLIFLPRHALARVWGAYCFVLCCLLLLQYLLVLGLPMSLCQPYPWTKYFYDLTYPQWIDFLFLPDYTKVPPISFLLADFFRFLFAILQLNVFRLEQTPGVEERGGGSNVPVMDDVMPPKGDRDFISVKESFVDYIMHGVLMYFYYVCLGIIFVTGLAINLLSLLYLIASFIFLWMGINLFTYKRWQLLKIWNCLIGFNLVVMFLKCGLQIAGCIYLNYLSRKAPVINDLFSVKCLNTYQHQLKKVPSHIQSDPSASQATVESIFSDTITWDVICFACMLLQRKIFSTRIFANIVLDVRVQKKFASRGAAIINSRLIREVTKQKLEESRNLARVRRKLERIRLRRQAWGVPTYQEHYKVLRSGDARLFEGDSDNEDESTVNANVDENDPKDDESAPNAGTMDTEIIEDQTIEEDKSFPTEVKVRLRKKSDKSFASHLPTPQDDEPHPLRALNLITRAIDTSPRTALEEADISLARPRRKSARSQSETGLAAHALGVSPSPPACVDTDEPMRRAIESDTSDRLFTSSDEWDVVRPQTNQSALPTTPEERPDDEIFEDAEEDEEEEESHRSCWTNFKASCIIVWRIFLSIIDSLVMTLNQITKEFRTIRLTLEAERKLAKRRYKEAGELSALEMDPQSILDDIVPDIRTAPDYNLTEEASGPSRVEQRISNQDQWKRDVQALAQQVSMAEKEFKKNQSRFFLLLIATSNFASLYLEQICYFVMVVNHLTSATILSMVYPFLIFCWGMLSVPRPSKLFWTVTITYTMIVIVVKYFFQFPTVRQSVGFLEGSDHGLADSPLTMEKLFGLKQNNMFAVCDLVQLMVIFLHRTFLKANGLWRAVSETREDLLQLAKSYGAALGCEERTSDVTSNQNATNIVGRMSRGTTITSDMVRHYELSGEHAYQSPLLNIKRFFQKMTDPLFNLRVDVYRWIFFVEFLSLIMLVLTYKSFVPYSASNDSVANYIQNSKVPMPFIAMCFMQFILILIDRSLFLQKLVFGKLIFQFILMVGIHGWMFFVLPFITNRDFTSNWAAQTFYFLKCVYFGLSAYQIRSGYPIRVLGNFLTKKYNYVNLFLYKGFLLVPFLMDLRCVMDWIWTETTLGLYHWNQMEHIYSIVYVVKCWHYSEDQWPSPRGQRRSKFAKYGLGGVVVGLILAAIWLPMLLFYILSATATPALPQVCDIKLSIGGFTPIFSVSIQGNRIKSISRKQFNCLMNQSFVMKSEKTYAVFKNYEAMDIAPLEFDGNSTVIWSITPPGLASLIRQLKSFNSTEMSTALSIKCKRIQVRKGEEATVSTIFRKKLNDTTREALVNLLLGSKLNPSVILTKVYPSFIRISQEGIESIPQINPEMNWANISVIMNKEDDQRWWRIIEIAPENKKIKALMSCLNIKTEGNPYIVSINERSLQKNVVTEYLTSTGLIGVYIVLVAWMAKTLRKILYASDTLRFDDMPQVDRLLRLLDDIYLVREHKDWQLEEELYSKLDYLWRSPETLIQYSKPKQD